MVKVRRYSGTVPASGKQVFKFGTENFCHRSVAKDKVDYLVRVADKAILRCYPTNTDRLVIIEDLASNIESLSVAYELVDDEVVEEKETIVSESCGGISMKLYSDGTVVGAKPIEVKKSYDLTKEKSW